MAIKRTKWDVVFSNYTRDKLVKKRWIATEESYKLLKMMLMKYTGKL